MSGSDPPSACTVPGNTDIELAVLQLVTLHTDFTQLLTEQSEGGSDISGWKSSHAYTDGLLHTVREGGGGIHSESSEVVTSSLMCRELQRLLVHNTPTHHDPASNTHNTHSLLLTPHCRREVDVFMESVRHLQQMGSLSEQHFVKQINMEGCLPLELVWLFHQHDVMSLEAFMTCNLSRPAVIGRLGQDVATLSQGGDETERRRAVITGLMCVLLKYGYSAASDGDSTANRGLRKVSCALLDSITKKSLQSTPDLSIFDFLTQTTDVPQENVKRFCARQLSIILSHKPEYKVSDALQQQQNWSQAKADPCKVQGYRELLSRFNAAEALAIFKNVIEEEEVNWRSVLTLTSVLLTSFNDASALLQVLCRDLVTRALEETQLDGLITGFLLARQAALEGAHVFSAYQRWFYSVFGEPHTTPATNKKTFTFLLKFLGDIVPYEPVQYLKAHILKPPCAPARCRPLLSDYLVLARTRLTDLGESMEESSIFDNSRQSTTDGASEQVLGDVDTAVESYAKNGKIPASVMEASIFRKPYFVGRFLPSLLKPRPLPDPPDTRMRLIESLHRADKIPKSLYSVYRRESEKMTSQLLEGVFTDADEEMEDLTLSPWQQLSKSLDGLKSSVLSSPSSRSQSVSAQLSLVYDKCCGCLQAGGATVQAKSEEINLSVRNLRVKRAPLKVIDSVLQCVGETLVTMTTQSDAQYLWLKQLVAMVIGHGDLSRTLYTRVLDLVVRQGSLLSRAQVAAVAAVCVHILSDVDLTSVKVDGMTLQAALTYGLRLASRRWVCFSFSFTVEYLLHADRAYPSVGVDPTVPHHGYVPLSWCQLLSFLWRRLSHSSALHLYDMDIIMATATQLLQSPRLQHLWRAAEMDVSQWLDLELRVHTTDDLITPTQRVQHCRQMVFGRFVPQLTAHEEIPWCPRLCTQVALAMLHNLNRVTPDLCACSTEDLPGDLTAEQFRPDVTSLLQSMVLLLPPSPRPLWVLELFSEVRQECEGNPSAEQNSIHWLLSLCDMLPPYLLMVNSLQQKTATDVNSVVRFITSVWRGSSTRGCVLSVSRAIYLAQAILSTQHLASDWLTVVKHCPLVTASLQFHWDEVSPLFEHSLESNTLTEVLQPIRRLHTSCKESLVEDSLSTHGCSPLLVATALLALVQREERVSVQHVVTMATRGDCVACLTEAVLCSLAGDLLQGKPSDDKLCELLITLTTTSTADIDIENTEKFTDLCSEEVLNLWPCVLLRAFVSRPSPDVQNVSHNSGCLSLLLKSHVLCTGLYNTGIQATGLYNTGIQATGLYNTGIQATGPLTTLCSQLQPLSLHFLLETSVWLKQRLREAPQDVRSQIDRTVYDACDLDLRQLVRS